jgi:hypothetical protein
MQLDSDEIAQLEKITTATKQGKSLQNGWYNTKLLEIL